VKIRVVDSGPDLDPEEVKAAIDLRGYLAPGVPIHGDRPVVMLCRFHPDRKTPNMHVYRDHAYCYRCGERADVFDFLGLENPGASFPELVKMAAEGGGLTIPTASLETRAIAKYTDAQDEPETPPPPLEPKMAEEYHASLGEHRSWFRGRGLVDSLIDAEKLGYNGRAFTIPVWDSDGKLITIRFRRDDSVSQKGPKYWGVEGFNRPVLYNTRSLEVGGDVVVVTEGELDALRVWQEGLPAVSATNGAGVFRQEWAAELWAFKEVVVCYDTDEAGRRNAARVASYFSGRVKVLDLTPFKDVTEFLQSRSVDAFLDLMEGARVSGVRKHWRTELRGSFWR
jgi:DNA primase